MVATIETLEKIVASDPDMQPDVGSSEASMSSFWSWFDAVKDVDLGGCKVKDFDCDSVLGMFDGDLKEFAKRHE